MAADEGGVLVTGGCGFLGRALVKQLLLRHASTPITVLALPHEALPPDWTSQVKVVRGDITRLHDVELAARGCRRIFHLAERVTVGGTAHVFNVALQQGAAVILTTSVCAYGDAIQRRVCDEDTPLGRPQGPYGQAKQGQEKLAWRFRDQGGKVCVVRPANIIGPGSGHWLLDAAHALRQGLPALVGGGQGGAALAIVDNVADFLVLASHTPAAFGQAFNIHDGLPITWRAYFSDLAAMMGTPPPRSTPRALAYLGARVVEPLFRRFLPERRPPVTREALNLIAWNNQFPTDKARSLGWVPVVDYPQILRTIQQDIQARGL